MSLRDRIAEMGFDLSRGRYSAEWEDLPECQRENAYEFADAVLADPEIAALREVAFAAQSYLRIAERAIHGDSFRAKVYNELRVELDAALARLEEAGK